MWVDDDDLIFGERTHLIFGRVVEQRVVALRVAVVQEVVVDQVPAPALVVRADQGDVAVGLLPKIPLVSFECSSCVV